MKEFSFHLLPKEPAGLPNAERVGKNKGFLASAIGVRGQSFGLERQLEIVNPFGASVVGFPSPQMFRTETDSLLISQSQLHRIDEMSIPWQLIGIPTYNTKDIGQLKGIVAGGQWHIASFGQVFYLFNGSCIVFRSGENRVFCDTSISVQTGCAHKGRILTGGFLPGVWPEGIEAIFSDWTQDERAFEEIRENWIMWSSIGGGDLPLWLLWPDEFGQRPTKARILEAAKENTFGFMPIGWQGVVRKMLPLGSAAIVYGDGGVTAMILSQIEGGNTYGKRLVAKVPVSSRDRAGGGDEGHLFIDDEGSLWALSPDLNVQRLGFRNIFGPLIDGPFSIEYDPVEREYYISADSRGFVLGSHGLYETEKAISSLDRAAGALVGVFREDPDPIGVEIISEAFNMNLASLKTLTGVSLMYQGEIPPEVGVDVRYTQGGDWISLPYRSSNKEGNVRLDATAQDFRVRVRPSLDDEDFLLEQIMVRWQRTDRRSSRAPDADPSFTGAGE